MKKIAVIAIVLMAAIGAQAQDCEARVKPMFRGNEASMKQYPQSKLDWYCQFAQASLYLSDTVPQGATVYDIAELTDLATGNKLDADFVVDLATMSYYAYDFLAFQHRHPTGDAVVCFATHASAKPYLVVRSINDATARANAATENK